MKISKIQRLRNELWEVALRLEQIIKNGTIVSVLQLEPLAQRLRLAVDESHNPKV